LDSDLQVRHTGGMKTSSYFRSILLALVSSFLVQTASAEIVGEAIFPPFQLPSSDKSVTGIRNSIFWGRHKAVYGLDTAFGGNVTDDEFIGMALAGAFNLNRGKSTIVFMQLAAINANLGPSTIVGFQLGGFNYQGSDSTVVGFQMGLVGNEAPKTKIVGMQVGLYNAAQTVYGIQFGLINKTKNLHGIQFGLLNFAESALFSAFPVINIGF